MRTTILFALALISCTLDKPDNLADDVEDLPASDPPTVYMLTHAGLPPTALDDLPHFEHADPGQDPLCPGGPGPEGVEVPAPTCAGAPILGAPRLLVDGVFADSVPQGARLGVLFPFAHSACELGCGTLSLFVKDHSDGGGGNIDFPATIPCSTADDDVYLAVDLGTVGSHTYEVTMQLTDVCGATSQQRHLVLTPD